MQKKIIVVATDQEYELACKYTKLMVIKTGVATSNVVSSLKDLDRATKLINIGFAGSNNLPVGSVVKIKNSYLYHPNVTFKEKVYNLGGNTDCYTSNDFVLQTKIKESVVFDMELNAICALGFEVESYKIVSDNLSLTDYERVEAQKVDLNKCFKKVFEIIEEQK
ncbi:MAG: hypothetical protein IJD48_04345 [Clostridia bacterium]|nr:hypothetical protein [Clostridia bacterium]